LNPWYLRFCFTETARCATADSYEGSDPPFNTAIVLPASLSISNH
jgi:hypothetical protein